jgi:acyl carrier protein
METVRTLIKEVLDLPVLLDAIGDDQDLVSGGINSGEVVRIALRCEQYLDRALTDEELAGLSSIRAIGELLEGKGR